MSTLSRRILAGRHPTDPYYWTLAYRSIRGESIQLPPYIRDLLRDPHPFLVIQKAAQIGISELLVSIALFAAATAYAGRGHVLYLLPTAERAEQFSQVRIADAIAESPPLTALVGPTEERPRLPDNARVRSVGAGTLYVRGGREPASIRGIDADLVILDEADEMDERLIQEAFQRLGSSRAGRVIAASTPRAPELGINELYLRSDRRRYWLPCPRCGAAQPLEWDANFSVDGIRCRERGCRAQLDVWAEGEWRAELPGNTDVRGYQLSRLYSPFADFRQMEWLADSPGLTAQREFINSVLGEPFEPPGGSLSSGELDAARREYSLPDNHVGPTWMGVDQGAVQHVVVRERAGQEWRLVFAGTLQRIADVADLARRFGVCSVVIDAAPSTHEAQDLIAACHAVDIRAYAAYYTRHDGRIEVLSRERRVNIDRTFALDRMYAELRDGTRTLPDNARDLGGRIRDGRGEYYRQLTTPKRILEEDAHGTAVYRYHASRDDHFAHAEVYCLAAAEAYNAPDITAAWVTAAAVNRELYAGPRQWNL